MVDWRVVCCKPKTDLQTLFAVGYSPSIDGTDQLRAPLGTEDSYLVKKGVKTRSLLPHNQLLVQYYDSTLVRVFLFIYSFNCIQLIST